MALTPASILADYTSGIGTQGATLKINTSDKRIGIGTTNPQGTLQVGTGVTVYGNTGIVSATNVKANTANFSGNVSVGGVLTYEDVTNVDSVGVITARQGIRIGAGQSIGSDGALTYYGNGFNLTGIDATAIKDSAGGTVRVQANTSGAVVTGILTATTLEQTQTYPTIRPTLDLNFAATKTLDRRITFTRDSVGTYIGENGLVKYASNNVPRFDHDPTTGESLGLLIEESRTNYAVYSSEFDNAAYNKLTATVVANQAVAPDGTTTADLMYPNSNGTGRGLEDQYALPSTGIYTTSMYVKAAGLSWVMLYAVNGAKWAYFNVATGVKGSEAGSGSLEDWDIIDAGNGWYRIYVTYNATDISGQEYFYLYFAGGDNSNSVTANGTDGVYMWGLQVEQGNFGSSYIHTNGTTVTRGADQAKITGTNFTDFHNATEGTLVSEHMGAGDAAVSPYIALLSDGTNNERIILMSDFAGYQVVTVNGGSNQAILDGGTPILNAKNKNATAFKKDDFALSLNGGTVATDTSGTMSVVDQLWIGSRNGGDSYMNNTIQSLKYYNKRLTNDQLQGLTA